jgi:hypothetical protein
MTFLLAALQAGNSSAGLTNPILNDNTTAEYEMLAPSQQAILQAINDISTAVFVDGATNVTPAIQAATDVILAEQDTLLQHLNNLNTEVGEVLLAQTKAVQTEQYIFMSVILAVLLVLALFFYLPLERRSR